MRGPERDPEPEPAAAAPESAEGGEGVEGAEVGAGEPESEGAVGPLGVDEAVSAVSPVGVDEGDVGPPYEDSYEPAPVEAPESVQPEAGLVGVVEAATARASEPARAGGVGAAASATPAPPVAMPAVSHAAVASPTAPEPATRYCATCGARVPLAADGLHCREGHRLSPAHARRRFGLLGRR